MTNIYCDETKGSNSSFQILTFIWGETEDCESFQKEVTDEINRSPHLFTSQTFHTSKVRHNNWTKAIWRYRWLLIKFRDYVRDEKLQVFSHFESKDTINRNAKYLYGLLDRSINNTEHLMSNIFRDIPADKKPVITNRALRLHYFLKFRDRFGIDGETFNFHPDSTGKALKHLEEVYPVHGLHFTNYR